MRYLLLLLLLALPAGAVTIAPGQSATVTCATGIPPTPPPAPPPTPPAPPPSGCTAKGNIPGNLAWGQVLQWRMPSGAVGSFPLLPPPAGKASIQFTQGQQPATPAGAVTEMTISRCPGVIDPSAGACYRRSDFVNNNAITAYTKAVFGWDSQAKLGTRGCWAPATAGPWYVNVRWTYASCPSGACGFSLQWAAGPW